MSLSPGTFVSIFFTNVFFRLKYDIIRSNTETEGAVLWIY